MSRMSPLAFLQWDHGFLAGAYWLVRWRANSCIRSDAAERKLHRQRAQSQYAGAPDGSWVLPNIPANFGLVRARATCIFNGQTVSGESLPFLVLANSSVNVPPIVFGPTTPIPTALVSPRQRWNWGRSARPLR